MTLLHQAPHSHDESSTTPPAHACGAHSKNLQRTLKLQRNQRVRCTHASKHVAPSNTHRRLLAMGRQSLPPFPIPPRHSSIASEIRKGSATGRIRAPQDQQQHDGGVLFLHGTSERRNARVGGMATRRQGGAAVPCSWSSCLAIATVQPRHHCEAKGQGRAREMAV